MAKDASFDIVSKVDPMEVTNAIHQTTKEIEQRFDLKGTKTALEYSQGPGEIEITGPDEFKLKSVIDILNQRLAKRNVSLKFLDFGQPEAAAGSTFRQTIKVKQGIDKEHARKITDLIKGLKLKVQAQIQDDQVRVSGKNKDDLQAVMQTLRKAEFDIELQFLNYR